MGRAALVPIYKDIEFSESAALRYKNDTIIEGSAVWRATVTLKHFTLEKRRLLEYMIQVC